MLGSLVVKLAADMAQFQSDLGRASQVAEAEMRKINAAVDTVKQALIGFGSAFLSAEAFGMAKEKFDTIVHGMAELDDAAEKTGASVESLSSILNTLRPSGATLGTVTDMAEKMVKAMQGADKETAKAAEAFSALGIDTRDALGNLRPVDEVLGDVARALNRYEDGSNKTAIAQALLGKAGAQYLPLLKDLATTTPVAASVTADMAAEAERLEKAFGVLKVQGEAFWQTMVSKIVPGLASLVEQFAMARKEGMNFWEAFKTIPGPNSGKLDQIKGEQDAIAKLQADREKLLASAQRMAARGDANVFIGEEIKRIDGLIAEREKRLAVLQKQSVALALAEDPNLQGPEQSAMGKKQAPKISGPDKPDKMSEGERLIRSLEQRLAAVMNLTEAEKLEYEIASKLVTLTPSEAARARVFAQQIDSVREMTEARKRDADLQHVIDEAGKRDMERREREDEANRKLAESFRELIDPAEQYRKKLEQLRGLSDDFITVAERQQAEGTLLAKMFEATNGMKEHVKSVDEMGKQLGNTFQSAFENAVIAGKSFGDVLKGLMQDITRLVLRQQVSGPLASWLSGLLTPQETRNGYITGGLREGAVWSGMDKSVGAGPTIVLNQSFASNVDATTMANLGRQMTAKAVAAVKEAQRR